MKITEVLVTEHIIFLGLFDQIDRALRQVSTVSEVHRLAGIVHALLDNHADTERDLAYTALDHILAERGTLDEMHEDHEEIDLTLRQATTADDLAVARESLHRALNASRKHFCFEEVWVFPLIERVLQPETLAALGRVWEESRPSAALAESSKEASQECTQAGGA